MKHISEQSNTSETHNEGDLTPSNGIDLEAQGQSPTIEQNEQTSSLSAEPPRKNESKPKTKTLTVIVILLAVCVVSGVYLWQTKKTSPSTKKIDAQIVSQPKPTQNNLYFQQDNKIVSYSSKSKQSEVLTDKIPSGSRMLDFYADDAGWRLYYYQTPEYQKDKRYRIHYLEKNKFDQEVYATTEEFVISTANAKAKIVALTEVFSPDPSVPANKRVNRHYVIKDGKTDKVAESASVQTENSQLTGLADWHYVTDSISSDGTKVLYIRIGRFYSESPPSNTGIEMDLAKKTTTLVYEGGQGSLDYLADGSYAIRDDVDVAWFGGAPDVLKQKLYMLTKPGSKPRQVLDLNESTWLGTLYSKDYTLLASTLRDPKDPQGFSGSLGMLYKLDLVSATKTQLDVKGLPSHMNFAKISKPVDGCYGVVLRSDYTSTNEPGYGDMQTGALCIDDKNKAIYTQIQTFDGNGKYDSFNVLN